MGNRTSWDKPTASEIVAGSKASIPTLQKPVPLSTPRWQRWDFIFGIPERDQFLSALRFKVQT